MTVSKGQLFKRKPSSPIVTKPTVPSQKATLVILSAPFSKPPAVPLELNEGSSLANLIADATSSGATRIIRVSLSNNESASR
jgi:hypothetical protein